MKTPTHALSLFASFAVLFLAPARAENLGELMEQVGLGAIVGAWVDEDTKGDAVTVTYEWRVKDHALALSVKSAADSAEALIGVDPATGQAVHLGIDSEGRMTKGTWSEEDGRAVLNMTRVDTDGQKLVLRITHKIIDNTQLVVGMSNPETGDAGEFTLVRKPE